MAVAERRFRCLDCGEEFNEPYGKPRWLVKCPKCGSSNIVRVDIPAGYGRGFYGRGWRGRGFYGRGRGFAGAGYGRGFGRRWW
jgi:DNA-directed RNA polymerase subunit RPC12/RpoP